MIAILAAAALASSGLISKSIEFAYVSGACEHNFKGVELTKLRLNVANLKASFEPEVASAVASAYSKGKLSDNKPGDVTCAFELTELAYDMHVARQALASR